MADVKEALSPYAKERYTKIERIFEIPVVIGCLLVIPAVALRESATTVEEHRIADITNWTSWMIFALEFICMLIYVPERRVWIRKSPVETFIVFATLPALLPYEFGILRLLALFRLVRLAKYSRKAFTKNGLKYASLMTLLTIFVGGAIFAALEKPPVSTWEGIWWAVQTVTTVGYGDIVPDTTPGKVTAIVIMFVGMGFVALFTAFVAERFIQPDIEAEEKELAMHPHTKKVLDRLDEISHRLEQLEQRSSP